MTIHIGEVTSEVVATGGPSGAEETGGGAASVWEERVRVESMLERLARDRMRTSTGGGDD